MIDYRSSGIQAGSGPLWSRTFLAPLAPGALTPFSASMLVEIAGGAWYHYYDRLGFAPTPKSRVARLHAGRPYVNLTLSAELDAQHAGREPASLRIDGKVRTVGRWDKPGFLAGMKLGRNARKIDETLDALDGDVDVAVDRGRKWLAKVQSLRWSQAEILQVMEEIERIGAACLMPFFAVRHNLAHAYGRLAMMGSHAAFPANLVLVNHALAGVEGLVESDMGRRVEELGARARNEPAALAWLTACERAASVDTLPDGDFARKLHEFIGLYGHRCAGEGELRHARWSEDLLPVLYAVLAAGVQAPAAGGVAATPEAALQALLASVDSRQPKEAQQLVQQIRRWLPLQSRALNAYAYVLAGTRFWALAAGREAMSDKRLLAEDDVFFYELEEVKEMMTGEWNVSDRAGIQATAAERKARWQASQAVVPGELLIGDQEAAMAVAAISAAPGKGRGTVVMQPGAGGDGGKVVLAGTQPDSGWAISLPAAAGVAVAQGAAIDPAVAAAAAWPLPVVYALGATLQAYAEGTPMVVDGDTGQVAHG